MMNQKQTLTQLLDDAQGKKLLFLGKEGIFTEKEIVRFLKPYNIAMTRMLEEGVAGVIEGHRLNPVEQDISDDAYAKGLPLYKLTEFEELLSKEIDDDALLMAIKLCNDQERVVRLLGNEHLSDPLFVRLLKLYSFDEEEEDNRQDRDVIMYTLRRYIDIRPNEEDLLYSYLTLRRLAIEATDPELLDALLGFPDFTFLIRGKESVTLRETIAQNQHIVDRLIRKLLALRDKKVSRALAGNEAVPLEVLKHLHASKDVDVLQALATNPNIDNALFAALLKEDEHVASLLLIHQPIDKGRYKMVEHRSFSPELTALMGANEHLDTAVVEVLLQQKRPDILRTLSANRMTTAPVLEQIYQCDNEETFSALAKNPATPVWILQALYEEYADDTDILTALAHNPVLPEPLLRALFEKNSFEINRGLATNDALPKELLDILKVDTRLQNELAQNEQLAKSYEEVLGQKKVMMNV